MRFLNLFVTCLLMLGIAGPAGAQSGKQPVIPNFWDPQERVVRPSLSGRQRLRFLTTTDFPPFSYIDRDKRLSGFHVDLARAICAELDLLEVCQIQALPFDEIEEALRGGTGDAALAGHAITDQTRQRLAFSRAYFRLPARFVVRSGSAFARPIVSALAGKPVGIVTDTAHAAYAQAHLGDLALRQFEALDSALEAVEKGDVEAVFSDGLAMSFWLQRQTGNPCCRFAGTPLLDPAYFGNGLAVALPKTDPELLTGLNFALRSISDKGIFDELYLRYFPISLY